MPCHERRRQIGASIESGVVPDGASVMPGRYACPPPRAETSGKLPLVRALLMRAPAIGHPPNWETPAGAPLMAFSANTAPCVDGLHGSLPDAPVSNVSNTTVLLANIAPGLTTTRSPRSSEVGSVALAGTYKLTNQPPASDDGFIAVMVDVQSSLAPPVTHRNVAPALGFALPSGKVAGAKVSCMYCRTRSVWLY